jgi:hypothetical protein
MKTPNTLEAALDAATEILTAEDLAVLRTYPLEECQWRLHFTLGYQLRNSLGLWGEDAEPLYRDLMSRVEGVFLVVDGDTASSALIASLCRRVRESDDSGPVAT